MKKNDNNSNQKNIINVGSSVAGALVGLAIGGPIGSLVGAASTPLLNITHDFLKKSYERKRKRAKEIVLQSFEDANITPSEALNVLDSEDQKTDDFIRILKNISETDPILDDFLSKLLAESLTSTSQIDRERILLMSESIRNVRGIHVKILMLLNENSGELSASKISTALNIPEAELRNVVRDLELRGMIKEVEKMPTVWKLRILGNTLISYLTK